MPDMKSGILTIKSAAYYQITTEAGPANVEVAVAEVQFCIVIPLTTVMPVTGNETE
ncbi:hypothetical protein ACNKHM_05110 [Shigella sonnei]